MMASINVLTERQSHMMVVVQKLNMNMSMHLIKARKDDKSDPDWFPTQHKEVREFEMFCKNMSHRSTFLREKFVSSIWLFYP